MEIKKKKKTLRCDGGSMLTIAQWWLILFNQTSKNNADNHNSKSVSICVIYNSK